MATKKSTELAEKKTTALATYDYGDHAGAGFDNVTKEDIAIPFLTLLQKMSPELDSVDGAKAGMILNTVTNEVSDTIRFVPAITRQTFVEWVPRDEGGGIVGEHDRNSDVVKKAKAEVGGFGKMKVGGNDLVETFYVYGVVLDEDDAPVGMGVIAMTSTKITVYKKQLITRYNTFQINQPDGSRVSPPLFAHRLLIGSVLEKRPKGDSYNFTISPANGSIKESLLPPDHPAFLAGADLRDLILSGRAREATESVSVEGEDDGDTPF
jgi:hypothetical protein